MVHEIQSGEIRTDSRALVRGMHAVFFTEPITCVILTFGESVKLSEISLIYGKHIIL